MKRPLRAPAPVATQFHMPRCLCSFGFGVQDELELCTQKDGQIETYRSELVELKKVKDQQRQGVAKQEFYEKYLRKVLQNTDEFSEINELIDRYVTLHLTNKDLVKLDNDCQARMDSLSKDQSHRQEEHRVRVLG